MNSSNLKRLFLWLPFLLPSTMCFAQSSLSIHGYLTQAYAFSRHHQIFGIPENGTSDYRNMALQFRYDQNNKNIVVIQLSHKRVGLSPVMSMEEEIELDWAFYQRKFGESAAIKIGKIQLPWGIYSEIRDVGILLPFYQVPYGTYQDGNYVSEAVDGISFWYSFNRFSSWEYTIEAYAGQWTWVEWINTLNPMTNEGFTLTETAKIENAFGAQNWLYTPMDGLRLGFGVYHGNASGGIHFTKNGVLGETSLTVFNFSLDATFPGSFVRVETGKYFLHLRKISSSNLSAQIGKNLFSNFSVCGQYGFFKFLKIPSYIYNSPDEVTYFNESAVSLKYSMTNNTVLKLESHWTKSFLAEDKLLVDLSEAPSKSQYVIFSFSTSF
ncbi:MAG: hypothetical protein H6696_12870 [Deferribacteres bacterium]|nr:hypothetical protein [candidate division KSB1 bacterium]MCB9502821.1 hypothetical protein [Deferribacteres bacterium]